MWAAPIKRGCVGALLAAISLTVAPATVHATCWSGGDAQVRRLQAAVDTDPKAALPRIDAALRTLHMGDTRPGEQRSWLLAVRTAALVGLVRYEEAEKTASSALSDPNLGAAARAELLGQLVAVSFSRPAAQLGSLLTELQVLRRGFPVGTPASVCTANTMSILQRALGSIEESLRTGGNAYREAKAARLDGQAAYVALNLTALISPTGDYAQADDLAREAEVWATRKGYTHQLLLASFMRAQVLSHSNPALAAEKFLKAAQLSRQLGMSSGAAEQGACSALLSLGKLDTAEAACRRAMGDLGPSDTIPRTLTARLLGDIALARGDAAEALARYNALLSQLSAPALGKIADMVRQSRSEALARLGRYQEAYTDLKTVNTNLAARSDAQRARDLADARARFGWDRQRIANAELERDLAKADARDAARRLWMWTVAGWAVLLAATLTWVVVTGRRHRRKLENLADEAREMARTKAELLANMSHEIRSPLGSLTLAATRLAQSSDIPEEGRQRAERLGRAGDRLIALLDDLLLFSRIDAKRLPVSAEPFDPRALVQEMASLVEPKAHLAGAELSVKVDPDAPASVVGDRNRLAQILTNLLDNAVRHANATNITLALAPFGSAQYRLTVADDGKGIPSDRRRLMFQRFSQVDGASASAEGSGLGLAICKGLAELLGGDIEIEDSRSGLKVHVTLPLVADDRCAVAVLARAA
ncbi:signal transduction histidine kinase [Novosphingobium sp. SG919]|nr:signal transduction histidine kinase [Novosphingobium sp. SG919]